MWDARVSVGIGDVSFESDNIVTSDGEAFRLSGRTLDTMGKKRLTISTPWCDFNKSIELVTRFADEVVSSWTAKQANVVYHSLMSPKTQKDMAVELGLSKQNFNSHWTSAKVWENTNSDCFLYPGRTPQSEPGTHGRSTIGI